MSAVFALDVHYNSVTRGDDIVWATRRGSSMTLRRARVIDDIQFARPDGRLRPLAKLKIEITGSDDSTEIGGIRTISSANVLKIA